jgi:hypothetical protein
MHQYNPELRGSEILEVGYELESRIINYKLRIFITAEFIRCSGNGSAFQAGGVVLSLSAGR